jgi:hypothetical protein
MSRSSSAAAAYAITASCLVSFSRIAGSQQLADTAFHFVNEKPAFDSATGPQVCMDVGHNGFASAGRNPGAYRPLVRLLEGDGFRVRELLMAFTPATLRTCDLLIIVDAKADANLKNWVLPHPSALAPDEIAVLDRWVRDGGGLLVIADHNPAPGAVADLGQRLGVIVLDGIAHTADGPDGPSVEVFARRRGEVIDHPVARGRNSRERVDSVATFTGHAFIASMEWSPVLKFGGRSVGLLPFPDLPRTDWPHFNIDGWLEAATRRLGRGRVAWLAEVSVCTALDRDTGMNNSHAAQNAQFCLNIHRWLAGVLGD